MWQFLAPYSTSAYIMTPPRLPQEAFYTPVLHILHIIRVRVPLVVLVLVHLDVEIRRD